MLRAGSQFFCLVESFLVYLSSVGKVRYSVGWSVVLSFKKILG